MKRFFSILTGLFLLASIQGQVVSSSVWFAPAVAAFVGNYITNGTFDSEDYWAPWAEFTLVSGTASYDNTAPAYIAQAGGDMAAPLVEGTDYHLAFDIVAPGPTWIVFNTNLGGATLILGANYTTDSYSVPFTAPAITTGGLQIYPSNDGAFTIDNIEITKD